MRGDATGGPWPGVATFLTGHPPWLVVGGEWRFVDALLFGAIASATATATADHASDVH